MRHVPANNLLLASLGTRERRALLADDQAVELQAGTRIMAAGHLDRLELRDSREALRNCVAPARLLDIALEPTVRLMRRHEAVRPSRAIEC